MLSDASLPECINDNLASWNDRAREHANGGYGDLSQLAHNPTAITEVVQRDFEVLKEHLPHGSLEGLKVLHLQCHIGTDTICWPRLGAREVWGLDFSPVALEHARALAESAGVDITFVEGDAREAATALADQMGTFDVIVTSVGTITWLPQLDSWARSIERLLAPGGVFMIRDDHPLLYALDCSGLEIIEDYRTGSCTSYDEDTSYTTDPSNEAKTGALEHTRNHNWSHDFQEIVGSLLSAGLTLEALGEHEVADWRSLPFLEFRPQDGGWYMPERLPQIPLTFSVVARKQA